jgi:hypothetical protein
MFRIADGIPIKPTFREKEFAAWLLGISSFPRFRGLDNDLWKSSLYGAARSIREVYGSLRVKQNFIATVTEFNRFYPIIYIA